MAKTANELLSGILKTVSKIDNNMKKDKKSTKSTVSGVKDALNISGALLRYAKVKPETTKSFIGFLNDIIKVVGDSKGKDFKEFSIGMVSISNSLPQLSKGLDELGKMRTKRVDKALGTMRKLYTLMYELGGGRRARRINRSIRLFNRLGRALRKITAPMRILANFLAYLGLSFVVFAISIVAASAILKLSTKSKDEKGGGLLLPIVGVVLGTVAVLVGMLVLLTISSRFLRPGLRVIKGIGKGLLMLSLGILGFTLSLLLIASAMQAGLGFGGIMKSLGILIGIIVGIVGLFALLGVAGRVVRKGVLTTTLIGIGLTIMALSMAFLLVTGAAISKLVGPVGGEKVKFLGKEVPPVIRGLGAVGMMFIGAAALFALLGFAKGVVGKGVLTTALIGVGLGIMALSMTFLTVGNARLSELIGPVGGEKVKFLGKEVPSVIRGLGMAGMIFIGAAALFALLGFAKGVVGKGVLTTALIGGGLIMIAVSVSALVVAAAGISKLMGMDDGKKVKFLGKEVPSVIRGLGMIGMIFIGAAALFALLGIPVVAAVVATGVAVSLGISASLLLLSHATKKLVVVSGAVPDDFGDKLELMISGLLQGVIGGISKGLTGKRKEGTSKLAAALKNTYILMGGMGLLFTVSLTLSMFAKALTAFAKLDSMRVITGYKKDTNEPIFGERINISHVSENISTSISTFLTALIQSTTGLSRKKAAAIKKMGKALTGRRGILSAVIQFADVLKLYAQFGPNNEIGYAEVKTDKDGKPILNANGEPIMIMSSVKIDTVATNIATSFSKFVEELTSHTRDFEFGGRDKRKMKRLTEALVGHKGIGGREKYGLLEPITRFAETLSIYAGYGAELKIPVIEDGKVKTTMDVRKVAQNVVKTLSAFINALADNKIEGDISKADKNLRKFDNIIDKTNKIAKSLSKMSKLSNVIKELGLSIGILSENLTKLNTVKLENLVGILSEKLTTLDKIGALGNVSTAYLENTNDFATSNKRIMDKSTGAVIRPIYAPVDNKGTISTATSSTTPLSSKEPEPINWVEVSQMIGDQVGAKVAAALKGGQFVFEFDTTKSGGTYFWSPS